VARPRLIKGQLPPRDVRAPFPLLKDQTLLVFASGISEETRVSVSLRRKITDEAVFDRLARAG
jgi:hypothetical protein